MKNTAHGTDVGINTAPAVPDMLINKYNSFVDRIFERINNIFKNSYNPVDVRLLYNTTKNHSLVHKKKQISKTSSSSSTVLNTKTQKRNNKKQKKNKSRKRNQQETIIGNNIVQTTINNNNTKDATESRGTNQLNKLVHNKSSLGKQKQIKLQEAHGTLYGLSSLKRVGNVRVNVLAGHTTAKCNFVLGPLVLKVEKTIDNGVKRELKSATATTTKMMGRVYLNIENGAATLHSIKVQQPKQVHLVNAENHDRTKDFLMKNKAYISEVISRKLMSIAGSPIFDAEPEVTSP